MSYIIFPFNYVLDNFINNVYLFNIIYISISK